jgi:glycosyltransferase involved in cell wall biosynthesis
VGKPVVYTLRVEELFRKYFGYLVNPYEEGETIKIIERYINDKELLRFHSQNGRQLAEIKYNWEIEGRRLVLFIEKFFNA